MDTPGTPTPANLSKLARDIAMDLYEVADVVAMHRLTLPQWEKIQEDPRFQAMLNDMIQQWQGASNTAERVKAKAAMGLEAALESMIEALIDTDIPLAQRVEAGKFIARLGELGEKDAGAPGDRVHISINMGAPTLAAEPQHITIDGKVLANG